MLKSIGASVTTTIVFALCAATAWSDRSVEDAIETSTTVAGLPATETGYWTVTPCDSCPSKTVTLNKESRLFFGDKQVSLPDLRKLSLSTNHSTTVFYRWSDKVVTRIVVADR